MDSTKSIKTLGTIFLIFGALFLAAGLWTHLLVFTALGPSFMALGIVFLAKSRLSGKPSRGW